MYSGLFQYIRNLVAFLGAKKKKATYIDSQKQVYPNQHIHGLKSFSATIWTYHDRSIELICSTYKFINLTLKKISQQEIDEKNQNLVNSFVKQLNFYKFVLTMHMMRKKFSATTPLSSYLENRAIDFTQVISLIKATQ